MQFRFADRTPNERYRLLIATVTPRPIAWVSTVSPDGVPNAAPFSFFNVFGEDPAILGFAINDRPPDDRKDTGRNIRASGEFVVNLVDERNLDAMNVTAAEFTPDVDEFAEAGLTAAPSASIGAPRIAESPVSFECTLYRLIELGPHRTLLLGEVQVMHIRDDMVLDGERLRIDTQGLHLIGRVQGNSYIRTQDALELPRVRAGDGRRAGG